MKPINLSQETPQRNGVDSQRQPTPKIVATLGRLAVATSLATMTLVAFHHNPDASTPSPTAVIWADPPSPPPPGATGNPDQQPRHVCTHWNPENNTTQDVPCDGPS
jgi:hypothetical protein